MCGGVCVCGGVCMDGKGGSGGGMVEIIGNANKAKLEHSTEVLHTHTNTRAHANTAHANTHTHAAAG